MQPNKKTTELSLVEISRDIWRLRKSIVYGTVAGVILGIISYTVVFEKTYNVAIPVFVDGRLGPSISDADNLISTFNSRFSSISKMKNFLQRMSDVFPEFKRKLEKLDLTVSELSFRYFSRKGRLLSVTRDRNTEDFIITVTLPFSITGDRLPERLLEIINDSIQESNTTIATSTKSKASQKINSLSVQINTMQKQISEKIAIGGKNRMAAIEQIRKLNSDYRLSSAAKSRGPVHSNLPGYSGVLLAHLRDLTQLTSKPIPPQAQETIEEIWGRIWIDSTNERMLQSVQRQVEALFDEETTNLIQPLLHYKLTLPGFSIEPEIMSILNQTTTEFKIDRLLMFKALAILFATVLLFAFVHFVSLGFENEDHEPQAG